MKKFLAILLASVMVFALAAPAMANTPDVIDEVWITIKKPITGMNVEEASATLAVTSVKGNSTGEELPTSAVTCSVIEWDVKDQEEDAWLQQTGLFSGYEYSRANIQVEIADPSAYTFNSSSFKVYINGVEDEFTSLQSSVVCSYSPILSRATITGMDSENPVIEVGETKEITFYLDKGANPGSMYFSQTPGRDKSIAKPGAIGDIEEGATSFIVPITGVAEGTVEVTVSLSENSRAVSELTFTVTVVPAGSTTEDGAKTWDGTAATAATTATTATSTAVKTGDASNAMVYVITLIALVACASVTVFATKKTK